MKTFVESRKAQYAVFAGTSIFGLVFALFTRHAWEDWYITYRVSKNLAAGNGLVYTVGEKVHAFTSPLGTLVPAFLSYLTGSRSDDLVLWLFRLIGCFLLGLSAVNLWKTARRTGMGILASIVMICLFAVDARIVDFSINGMETAFMMFFLTSALYALSSPSRKAVTRLGLSWAGLMWTRPDGVVYVGVIALGYLLFKPPSQIGESRKKAAAAFGRAGLLAGALYLPWVVWAWWYFGSPLPHTITAKGLSLSGPSIAQVLAFPFTALFGSSSIMETFTPPYYLAGWPTWLIAAGKYLGLACAFYWVFPGAGRFGRAVSFSAFLAHGYLTCIVTRVAPWYVPNVTLLSIVVLGQIAQDGENLLARMKARLHGRTSGNAKMMLTSCCGILVLFSLLQTAAVGYQMRMQQEIIETGNRKQIGLWLREHASPGDTVFLECLGYIGFYSQLKMYDFPGLSSPEVVAMRRRLRTDEYAPLIRELHPVWLVLRPMEIDRIDALTPSLLSESYSLEKVFDVSDKVQAHRFIPGRGYLQFDQIFSVFKRRQGTDPG